jgi:hypothetical protein
MADGGGLMPPWAIALIVIGTMLLILSLIASRITGSVDTEDWDAFPTRKRAVKAAVRQIGKDGRYVQQGRLGWSSHGGAYVYVFYVWWRVPCVLTAHILIQWAAMYKMTGADKA